MFRADRGASIFTPRRENRSSTGRILNGQYIMSTFGDADGVLPGEHMVTIKVVAKNSNVSNPPPPLPASASLVEQETYIVERSKAEKESNSIDILFPKSLADRKTTSIPLLSKTLGEPIVLDFDSSEFE